MKTLIRHIKHLLLVRENEYGPVCGSAMSNIQGIENAWLLIEEGKINDYGAMETCPDGADKVIDAVGKLVLPTWCDAHTHIVFAASREEEFVQRIQGKTYEEIAASGGGILHSARKLQQASEDALFESASHRLKRCIQMGTGAIEIKSGYGLTVESELKMLRVIQRLKEMFPIPVKANLLAAHAIPEKYKHDRQGYLNVIVDEIIPEVANQKLADFIDVFCEEGFFTVDETDQILQAGISHGLRPKIHANQLAVSGGVQVGVAHNAISVDHLEQITSSEINALKQSNTIPVALPGCSFFLNIPYTPARQLIDEGLPVAIASDYNPGSCPSGNMNLIVSLASVKMNLLPEEAIHAATINAAHAMGVEKECGSISRGKRANLMITKEIPSYNYIPYSFGEAVIDKVMINGGCV